MDKRNNPFSPGAGTPPPELVGRDPILEQADILLDRVQARRSEKSILLTGLRGVGKTVLLNEIKRRAEGKKYHTILIEASESKPLGVALLPSLQKLLFALNRLAGMGNKAKRALQVLKSFSGTVNAESQEITVRLDIDPEKGSADSGDLESDLSNLFIAIGEAAQDKKSAVALFVDEIQYFKEKELGALIMAIHQMQQHQLPFVLVGAGLPTLPALAGDAKSYAERLFDFPKIGSLSDADVAKALQEPAQQEGVLFTPDALREVFAQTKGYPYFVQEWGYQAWNYAVQSPITEEVVQIASRRALERMDDNFFRVRYDRLTPSEKIFLRAMAQNGSVPCRIGDIADILRVKVTSLSPRRKQLLQKGMIYSPTYGELAFTVPLFGEFMIRMIPKLPAE